jgi:predicted small secreted protein
MNLNQYIKNRVQNILNERLIQNAQSNIDNNIDNADQNIVNNNSEMWRKYRTENIYNAINTLIRNNIAEGDDYIYNRASAKFYIHLFNSSNIKLALDYQKKHKALKDEIYKSMVHDNELVKYNKEVRHALKTLKQIVKPITNNDPNWIDHILITMHATYRCVPTYYGYGIDTIINIKKITFEIWKDAANKKGRLERIDLTEFADLWDEKFFADKFVDEQKVIEACGY